MLAMKKGQRVNKFPGSGFITNKVSIIIVIIIFDSPNKLTKLWYE